MMSRVSYKRLFINFFTCRKDKKTTTVANVDLNRYLGKWYEIARYTQWFERGLSYVTAEYSLSPKNKYIRVTNSGVAKGVIKKAFGKAYVVPYSGNSKLRVQFFWPFKGDYWIIDLDENYQWAVVSDLSKTSLWILSRTAHLDIAIYQMLLDRLKKRGFDLNKLDKIDQQ